MGIDRPRRHGPHETRGRQNPWEATRRVHRPGWAGAHRAGPERLAHEPPTERLGGDVDQELPAETSRYVLDYLARHRDARPWLRAADDEPLWVRYAYVLRDQSGGHDLRRHEGWRGTRGQLDRVLHLRDPARVTDDAEYFRASDAYGNGRLHRCGLYATRIATPRVYASAVAHAYEHPLVQVALDTPVTPGVAKPDPIRDIPIETLIGPDGHRHCHGFRLVGDDLSAEYKNRERWAKAVRHELNRTDDVDEAIDRVRRWAHERGVWEPQVEPIPTFENGTVTVQFDLDPTRTRFEIATLYVSPPTQAADRRDRSA